MKAIREEEVNQMAREALKSKTFSIDKFLPLWALARKTEADLATRQRTQQRQ